MKYSAAMLLLRSAATESGITVPTNPTLYKTSDFPHWFVYMNTQLGITYSLPVYAVLVANAKLVAAYNTKAILHTTPSQLIAAGFLRGGYNNNE